MSTAERHRAFLALGSNVDPADHLRKAVRELASIGCVVRRSTVYETAPVGTSDPRPFLNAAVLLETTLSPHALQGELRAIEAKLGRVRDPNDKYAPRTIDIDLALYDDAVLDLDGRRVPDPDILARAFVAIPLAELDPDYVHPETGETLSAIAARFVPDEAAMRPVEGF